MKCKLTIPLLLFSVMIIFLTFGIYYSMSDNHSSEQTEEQIVAINEIIKLAETEQYETLSQKAASLQNSIHEQHTLQSDLSHLFILCGVCLLFLIVVFLYVYFSILRPFDKMKQYAAQLAQGNFDIPLHYERSNYFGEFTWAFDNMRLEITKSRSCEREAILNNKTVIATLSHDIKTPVSSIRAYAEGLEANFDSTPEKRKKYLNIIMKKCDEVSRLTNDLFLHSLSDLDKLKMNPEQLDLCNFIEYAVSEIDTNRNDLHFTKPDYTAMVCADRTRLLQLVENLTNNSRKYAKTPIDIHITKQDKTVSVHIRDYGAGIPDEDMPFIFNKFYRGRNCGSEQGSGLGLYIVKYITEQMKGTIILKNQSDGLEAVLILPIQMS